MRSGLHRKLGIRLAALVLLSICLSGVDCGKGGGAAPTRTASATPAQPSPKTSETAVASVADQSSDRALLKVRSLDLGDGVILDLVWVPSGSLAPVSASATSSKNLKSLWSRQPTPIPAPAVLVSGFWMGKSEVTNRQYRRFKSEYRSGESLGMTLDGDLQPAVNVSPEAAQAFCRWLSDRTSETVRLPKRTEWEYACRAGTTTTWYWGDDESAAGLYANVADSALKEKVPEAQVAKTTDGFAVTAPVGSFKPNAFGLYDMIGNATEWCEQEITPRAPGGPTGAAPRRLTLRLYEAGSWGSRPVRFTPAETLAGPGTHDEYGGFRIVCEPKASDR